MAQQQKRTEDTIDISDIPRAEDSIDFSDIPSAEEETTPIIETQPSLFRKTWDTINEPIVKFPNKEEALGAFTEEHPILGKGAGFILDVVEGASSPLGVATGGLGGAEIGAGKLGLNAASKFLGRANKVASAGSIGAGLEDISQGNLGQGLAEVGMGSLGFRKRKPLNTIAQPSVLPTNQPVLTRSFRGKGGKFGPRVAAIANPDGTFTEVATGSIYGANGKMIKAGNLGNKVQAVVPTQVTPQATHLSAIIADKKGDTFTEIMTLPRSLQSSWDLSFPFRQGLGSIHKKAWWTSWDNMIAAYGSENAFKLNQAAIEARPLFKPTVDANGKIIKSGFAQSVGLHLTELADDLTKREEAVMSTWAEKVPGVRRSNRAYTTFGNQLRADMFEQMVNNAKKLGLNPESDLVLAKQIAQFVNTASGRGSLGQFEQNAKLLNSLFFSPRLITSRINTIKNGLDPRNIVSAISSPDPAKKMMAREAIYSLSAMTGAWTAMAGAAKMAGAEVSLDPNSPDFGKIKIGNTRLDPAGGLQQYLVLVSKMASGTPTSSTSGNSYEFGSKFGLPTRSDALVNFATNKTSPWIKYGWDLLNADKNRPVSMFDRTARMALPLVVQDLLDVMQEDPAALPIILPASTVGFGSQTYDERGQKESMFGEGADIKWQGGKLF